MSQATRPAEVVYPVNLGDATTSFSPPARALIIGGAGVLNITTAGSEVPTLTKALPAGVFPVAVKTITAASTTATEITALLANNTTVTTT